MEKFVNRIERILIPFGAKLQNVMLMQAIPESLQATLSTLIVGSSATLISSLDVGPWQGIVKSIPGLIPVCQKITSFTSGGSTLLTLTALAQLYCKKIEVKEYISCTALTVVVSLTLSEVTDGNIVSSALDIGGMMLALLVGISMPKSVKALAGRNVRIRIPNSVPKFVEEGFMILLLACIICIMASVINYFFTLPGHSSFQTPLYPTIQTLLQGIGLSFGGFAFISCLGALVMWSGLHASTISALIQPLVLITSAANLEVWNLGKALSDAIEYSLVQSVKFGGGANLLSPCLIASIFCKPKQSKSVVRLGIVPAVFCIGESILFGFPMILNSTMLIPMILSTITTYTIYYVGIVSGTIGQLTGAVFPWTTPPILNVALSSSTPLRATVMQLAAMAVGMLIYYPLVKGYDNRLAEKEKQAEQMILE